MLQKVLSYAVIPIMLYLGQYSFALDNIQDLANQFQYQSTNTQNNLLNYQQCYKISWDWWQWKKPGLALDFFYEAARQADGIFPAQLAAMKLLDLAELASQEYRDRYVAEEMIGKARDKMQLIISYDEWKIPNHRANDIQKEVELLAYLPRGKYIPHPVTLPIPGTARLLTPDIVDYNQSLIKEEKIKPIEIDRVGNINQEPIPQREKPKDLPPLPPEKKRPPIRPPPDKPKPPGPPDRPPLPPPDKPSGDTTVRPPLPPLPPDVENKGKPPGPAKK